MLKCNVGAWATGREVATVSVKCGAWLGSLTLKTHRIIKCISQGNGMDTQNEGAIVFAAFPFIGNHYKV